MLNTDIKIHAPLIREVTREIYRSQLRRPQTLGLIAGGIFLLDLFLFWTLPVRAWQVLVILDGILLLTIVFAVWLLGVHYEEIAEKNFQLFFGAPASVSFDEEAYHFQASWGSGSIAWKQFNSFWRLKSAWVLMQHLPAGFSVVLPLDQINQEVQTLILTKATQHAWQKRGQEL